MGAIPTTSLSIKEKKLVATPCGDAGDLRPEYSTHQLAVTVIANTKPLCKPSSERQASWFTAEDLEKAKNLEKNKQNSQLIYLIKVISYYPVLDGGVPVLWLMMEITSCLEPVVFSTLTVHRSEFVTGWTTRDNKPFLIFSLNKNCEQQLLLLLLNVIWNIMSYQY